MRIYDTSSLKNCWNFRTCISIMNVWVLLVEFEVCVLPQMEFWREPYTFIISELFKLLWIYLEMNFDTKLSFYVRKFEIKFCFVQLDHGCHIKSNVCQGQNFTHAVKKPPHPCRLLALKAMQCAPQKYRVFPSGFS